MTGIPEAQMSENAPSASRTIGTEKKGVKYCKCGCGIIVKNIWSIGHNRRGVPPTNKKGIHYSIGYAWVYMPSHPKARKCNGYVKRSRLVAEFKIGRYLKRGEVVHHINGDKTDDSIKNIDVLPKKEHDRISMTVHRGCYHPGCIREHGARGLCKIHYGRYKRAGTKMPFDPTRKGGKTRNEG